MARQQQSRGGDLPSGKVAPPQTQAPAQPDRPPACETCRYRAWPNPDGTGQCRRYPPTVGSRPTSVTGPRPYFPLTTASDWCGEYQPAPPKPTT